MFDTEQRDIVVCDGQDLGCDSMEYLWPDCGDHDPDTGFPRAWFENEFGEHFCPECRPDKTDPNQMTIETGE